MIITDYANFTDELLISGTGSSYTTASETAILSFKACCPSDLQTLSVRCQNKWWRTGGLVLEFTLSHPMGPPEALHFKLSLTQTSACVLLAPVTKQRLMTVDETVFSLAVSRKLAF